MTFFEFFCPVDRTKRSRFTVGDITKAAPICEKCNRKMVQVWHGLLAKENLEHGVQR
jgi:hypothetical protein